VPDIQPSTISGVLGQPFAEQLAFFRQKLGNLVPTQSWDDVWKEQHDIGFMVAGATKADLLADLAAAIDRAIAEGTSIDAWRKDFFAAAKAHGWTGWTGEDSAAGRAWRTRIIYVTNTKTAYHAGRLAQLRSGNFALWVYRHNDSVRHPRPLHVSWNGITLPPDHIFWTTHYTPNGWGCECYIVGARSDAGAARVGGDPAKPLPNGWDSIDPKTGEPPGVDAGWGYMPGNTVSDAVQDMAAKTQQWEYTLAKAYMQSVPEATRDALATAYRNLPSVADDVRRYAQSALASAEPAEVAPYRTIGLLTQTEASEVQTLTGIDAANYDFALDRSTVLHVQDVHGDPIAEGLRGQQAVTTADYALLPQILNAPDGVAYGGTSDIGRPIVQFWKVIGGRRLVAAFEVRSGRNMLALQSYWIGNPGATPP
jgi:hypothetical protein